ncbi:MAG TPA: FAD-dependent oxidoreductase [Candidatus Binatia bacterium]|nr:FAD-dependent oxidoreductase [Candidatus Binatia bacterium]
MKAELVKKRAENSAKTIISFWFKPERPLDQIAGQYIELTLPAKAPSGRSLRRWFTLSSSPTEAPLICITTKFSEPSSDFKKRLKALKVGQAVIISDPLGDFVLPKDSGLPLVFVAGGIGITPFRSILKYLSDRGETRQISLIYLVTADSELIFQPLLKKFKPRQIITNNFPVSPEDLLGFIEPSPKSLIYLAGPEAWVETLAKQLSDLGINRSRLVLDLFEGYSGQF